MKRIFLLVLIGLSIIYGCKKNPIPQNTVTNYELIPNCDFENWEPSAYQGWFLPGWTTNNTMAISTAEVDPDSLNAYHGKYAMKLSNTLGFAYAETKFPITIHPLSLMAFVKFKLVPSDTATIFIKLFLKGKEVDSGAWFGTKSTDDYKQINIPISQHSARVDSALIGFKCGNHLMKYQQGLGSKFWVDYLFFQTAK